MQKENCGSTFKNFGKPAIHNPHVTLDKRSRKSLQEINDAKRPLQKVPCVKLVAEGTFDKIQNTNSHLISDCRSEKSLQEINDVESTLSKASCGRTF